MNWLQLTDPGTIGKIKEESFSNPVLIFKHSTRCSISSTAYTRLERNWKDEMAQNMTAYYLDLLNYRAISNQIAETFSVRHESPQVLVIRDGKCIYSASHLSITFDEIIKNISVKA